MKLCEYSTSFINKFKANLLTFKIPDQFIIVNIFFCGLKWSSLQKSE